MWASAITETEKTDIERIQKTSFRIIYQEHYKSYENALKLSTLPKLSERRNKLMLNFALKCLDNSRTASIFPRNEIKTRQTEVFKVPYARTERY